jgi:tRNA A-37 threonylcarbamoyl transferase component Bud32
MCAMPHTRNRIRAPKRGRLIYHGAVDLHGPSSRPPKATAPTDIAALGEAGQRYEVHGTLGQGGMAIVYDATEVATGRRVALKRLQNQVDLKKRQRNTELFEREFHALSQLAHPRIVEVYGYGIDASGVHYTMELLDGGDLQQLSPLPWRRACSIARDVCSALSLLHSRRLVHRDVSPRNVRRAQNGFGKLIDFGAMAPMGSSKIVVGTPPCCAPESVHLQPLDGRTDLYALGATLYYSLVGHHAYAARHFAELKDAWSEPFARPSELVEGIPEALDALVLDLLRLEPDARPANAAEVMQRLAAIVGEPHTEQLQVAQAYLSTPTLVGREEQLLRIRGKLERTVRGRQLGAGQVVVIEGSSGVGRSRFLDACVLEATLLGAAPARADADDAVSGDYGVVCALARQLLTVMPQAALETARPWLPLLGHLIPELQEAEQAPATESAQGADSRPLRSQLQAAVRAWFKALSERNPVVIAVDDFHRIDEPSTALLALLGHEAADGLCLLVSTEIGAVGVSEPAQKLLSETATHVRLEDLVPVESENLLKSLFGEVPHVGMLARRLHELANGNPRDLLRLAQHLVDRRAVRYEAGAWTLPARIDDADLPSSMAEALRARIEALHEPARALASAFALCTDQSFTFDECVTLSGVQDAATLMLDLDELIKADIVRRIEDRFGLSRTVWATPLCSISTPELARELHVRLAQVLERRDQQFRAGQHWLRAGQHARALDVLVAHAAGSQEQTVRSADLSMRYARSLPADWFQTYEQALQLCAALGRPERDAFVLRSRLVTVVPALGVSDHGQAAALLAQIKHDSGLEDWEALDPMLDPMERITRAIALAAARYAATADHDRVLDPTAAIPMLARAVTTAIGGAGAGLDVAKLRSLPVLAAFAPISPALAVLDKLHQGMDARYSGRTERARVLYHEVLVRITQPDRAGLDEAYCELMRLGVMNALGMIEAAMGLGSSLDWAARIEAHPSYQANAVQTRMLHHLFQGDVRAADQCKKQVERLRIEHLQLYEGAYLLWETTAHTIAEDLTRVRHTIEELAPLAYVHEPWRPVQHYAMAEYHRIRGDAVRALAESKLALTMARPGVHQLWASIASTHVRALYDLGRYKSALSAARTYVAVAQRAELGYVAEYLWMVLALCEARVGRRQAEHTADAVIGRLTSLGIRGLHLGLAHETRARVALSLEDGAGFSRHAELCQEAYGCYRNPALLAKYRRLRQDAERSHGITSGRNSDAPDSLNTYSEARIAAALERCRGAAERAQFALEVLVGKSGAKAGLLFTRGADGLECSASTGGLAPTPELWPRILEYLDTPPRNDVISLSRSQSEAGCDGLEWSGHNGQRYRPVLLHHDSEGMLVVTGVALLTPAHPDNFNYPGRLGSVVSRLWADSGSSSILLGNS